MPIMGSNIAETKHITENGVYDVTRYTGANVEVDPVTTTLNVTPTTSAQQLTPITGIDGFSEVNVSAVDNTIDANITQSNIKKNVTILGVTGTYEGITPSGTYNISNNGTYNITNYANVNVNVSGGGSSHSIERIVDSNGVLQRTNNVLDLTGVTGIGNYALYYAYAENDFTDSSTGEMIKLDFDNIINISGYMGCYHAFQTTRGIEYITFNDLTTVSGWCGAMAMFADCSDLQEVDMPSLTTLSGESCCSEMFTNCTNLCRVSMESLTSITATHACKNMFARTAVDMESIRNVTTINGVACCEQMFANGYISCIDNYELQSINGNYACDKMFRGCSNLSYASFAGLTSITNTSGYEYSVVGGMFYDSGLVEIYFPVLNVIETRFGPTDWMAQMFGNCADLSDLYFGGLTASTFANHNDQFYNMFNSNTGSNSGAITIHMPANFDPDSPNCTYPADSLYGYPDFGAQEGMVQVIYDLDATE